MAVGEGHDRYSKTNKASSGSLKEVTVFVSVRGTWIVSLLFLCEVESQRSRPVLPGAAESHGSHRQE